MQDNDEERRKIAGVVKWFDAGKGFGFLTDPDGGSDILLHANVLRNFGQSSVAEGSHMVVIVQKTPRGMQVLDIVEIAPPASEPMPAIADLCSATPEEVAMLPLLPARVKWFDKAKGFGFANVFGDKADVFLHIEVLRHSGFSDLAVGEAIALRAVDGRRGMMAAQVLSWERAAAEARPAQSGGAPRSLNCGLQRARCNLVGRNGRGGILPAGRFIGLCRKLRSRPGAVSGA